MNRKQILSTSGGGGPLAWFYANETYITFGASTEITRWADRSNNGNTIVQDDAPQQLTWEASGGWDGSHPSVRFLGGAHQMDRLTGSLAALRGPFSVLMTFQNQDPTNNTTLMAWHNNADNWTAIKTAPSGGNAFIRFERYDGATLTGVTGTTATGSGHRRLAVIFDGAKVWTYLDAVPDLVASAIDTAVMPQTDRFSLAWTGILFSAFGRVTEILIYGSAIPQSLVTGYQASSLINWGA